MGKLKLRDYQENFVLDISRELVRNKKVVAMLATGGGKTISFSAICERYIKKSGKSVLILVHRKELLKQAVKSLHKSYGIKAQPIVAGMRIVPEAPVYVAMVETAFRRLDKFKNIGLIIIDEAHIGNFTKIIDYYSEDLIIGFTATPLSSNKSKPMKKYFNSIVCGINIPELIKNNYLCQNITYAPSTVVEREKLKMKMGEFDEQQMAVEFSNPKYIQSTVDAYEGYSLNRKTIIFNCNVEHSKLVNNAFLSRGYNSRHIDAESTDREEVFEWFDATPDAILCNVGIATTGFDQQDIETVIVNKSTASMPLWLQMCGRGGRTHDIKKMFTIVDMGGNTVVHGDWSVARNWIDIFENPPKKGDGVAPVKKCEQCGAMVHARKMICETENLMTGDICMYEFPAKDIEEEEIRDFMVMTDGIDVQRLIDSNDHYKEYYVFYRVGKDLALQAKNVISNMTEESYNFIALKYENLAREWCKKKGKRFNKWHKEQIKENLTKELLKHFQEWKKY